MARLQTLELPGGPGDDRPPFILVIDEVPSEEAKFDAIRRDLLSDGDLAPRLGARAVLVFEETIEIPANELGEQAGPLLRVDEFEGDEEILRLAEERDELHAEIGLAHGQLHSAALSAIRGKHANIHELIERAEQAEADRQKTVARILNLPEQPELGSADRDMADYLQGYGAGVRAAKRAARDEQTPTVRGPG